MARFEEASADTLAALGIVRVCAGCVDRATGLAMTRIRVAVGEVALCLVLVALAPVVSPSGAMQSGSNDDVREHIESQDPGYLKIPVRILDRSTQEVLWFDPLGGGTATISFRLTRPAPIRVRIVRRDRPALLLRSVLDWEPLELGRNEVQWDGRDASGNLTDNRKVAVVIEGKHPGHSEHPDDDCRELVIAIAARRVPERPASTFDVEVLIERGSVWGARSGYRVLSVLDWQTSTEHRISGESASLILPRIGPLPPGDHVVTVTVDDGEDHLGAASCTLESR